MFVLMTYLAVNIPGNPDVITCMGVESNGGSKIKSCIAYEDYDNNSIPKYKLTLDCETEHYFFGSNAWTVYPNADVVIDGAGQNFVCKVIGYKDLIQANR